jgi:Rrf2 family transcriptional regulator, nitric oxide-sensitive transcriptional repressor
LGLKSHGVRLCPLHKRLDDALAMVENAFARTTLAEVLAEPTTSVPLCEFPPRPSTTSIRQPVKS